MTKEEANSINEVKVELAALTAELKEQNKTQFEILSKHDQILSGDYEHPGLGTRVALLERFSKQAKSIIATVFVFILGLIGNAINSFMGAK